MLVECIRAIGGVTIDGVVVYPCATRFEKQDNLKLVYFGSVGAIQFLWPSLLGDSRFSHLLEDFLKVTEVAPSPNRLPQELAEQLYRGGESGMGFFTFVVKFMSGREQFYSTGNFVDFLESSDGDDPESAVSVIPHERRQSEYLSDLPFTVCIVPEASGLA